MNEHIINAVDSLTKAIALHQKLYVSEYNYPAHTGDEMDDTLRYHKKCSLN